MTGKTKLYISLLSLGLVLIVGDGCGLRFNSAPKIAIPEGTPVIAANALYEMRGESNSLSIYEDGSIIYIEEENLRMPTRENSPTRTWKRGKLQPEELSGLLEFIKNSGFEELDKYYQFPGKPTEGGGFTMGDMKYTVTIDYRNLHKTVTAFGYLTYDHDLTYPDMPYPLNETYKRLKQIADNQTEEVARESI